ncbi:hypothetical protein HBB16_09040 [Pseudonocardia sp. MCCB 268]|nr:hypothetical protein [Pseudonocardia cytotoxica]
MVPKSRYVVIRGRHPRHSPPQRTSPGAGRVRPRGRKRRGRRRQDRHRCRRLPVVACGVIRNNYQWRCAA